jgi:hypothetical protein
MRVNKKYLAGIALINFTQGCRAVDTAPGY